MTTFFALVNVPYEMLRRWFIEEKKSGKDIAKILHDKHQLTVTRNAVMGRLHRLGIARNEIAEPSRASRPPKTRVVEMQASDLGLDSFGEFMHLKDAATAALLEKELEKPVEVIPQPPSTSSEDSSEALRSHQFADRVLQPIKQQKGIYDDGDPDTEDEQAFLKRQAERKAQQIPANRLIKDYAKPVMPEARKVPIVRTAPKVETPRIIEKPTADPYANDPFKNAGIRRPPPEPTRPKILSLPKVVEAAPVKKELAAVRDVVVWSEIEELIFGPVVPRPDGRKILQHLRDADCRWPIGEDSEGRVLFCARKCEPGASVKFCPKHADGAFQGTSRTKAQSEIDRNRALMAQASKKKMPH